MPRVAILALLLGLSSPLTLVSAQSFPALKQPQFVEIGPGAWMAFPSPRAALDVQANTLRLRSADGARSLEIRLPEGWTAHASEISPTRFTEIRRSGARALPAALELDFRSADGTGSFRIAFSDRDSLRVSRRPTTDPLSALAEITATSGRGSPLPAAVTGPGEDWTRLNHGSWRWTPSPSEASAGATDPLVQELTFGSFLGGDFFDNITDVALASTGEVLVAGATSSLDFPSTSGVFDPTSGPGADAFLASVSRDGKHLHFATFFGGSGTDYFEHVVEDSDGTIVLAGGTESVDLPVSAKAFDVELSGDADPFLARLSGDGTAYLGGTYIGGSTGGLDRVIDVSLDSAAGNVVLSGSANSGDWPTTPGAYQQAPVQAGGQNGFVSRLSSDFEALAASTLFANDFFNPTTAACLLSDGSVVFAGSGPFPPELPDPPTGQGAFPSATAADDTYLVRMSADLSQVLWATWIPAVIWGIHEKPDGSLVMVGLANAGFPTTPGAFNASHEGSFSSTEYVVCNITPDAQQLLWSTYINSGLVFAPRASELDDEGRLTFASVVVTLDYPFTADAYDTTFVGSSEFAITVVAADGSDIEYASLIGVGSGSQDSAVAMALDDCGGAFVAGRTSVPSFPTTPGAIDPTHNGNFDGWIVRLTTINPWEDLGFGKPGSTARPRLAPSGPLCEGDPTSIEISDALAGSAGFLVLGLSRIDTALKGGVLVPAVDFLVPFPIDSRGGFEIDFDWPPGAPSGFEFWMQGWIADPGVASGFAATNAVLGATP